MKFEKKANSHPDGGYACTKREFKPLSLVESATEKIVSVWRVRQQPTGARGSSQSRAEEEEERGKRQNKISSIYFNRTTIL